MMLIHSEHCTGLKISTIHVRAIRNPNNCSKPWRTLAFAPVGRDIGRNSHYGDGNALEMGAGPSVLEQSRQRLGRIIDQWDDPVVVHAHRPDDC